MSSTEPSKAVLNTYSINDTSESDCLSTEGCSDVTTTRDS